MDVANWKGMRDDAPFVNALLRQALLAIEEVMGKHGLNVILKDAGLERYVDNPPPNNLEAGAKAAEYARLNEALEKALMDSNPDSLIVVEEKSDQFFYTDYSCAICHTRHADKPVCHLYVGSLEEALKWASGQDITVEETQCKARGDPCC